jgi:hypothetical protein
MKGMNMRRAGIAAAAVVMAALVAAVAWGQAPASNMAANSGRHGTQADSAVAAGTVTAAVTANSAAAASGAGAKAAKAEHKLEMAKKAQATAAQYLVRVATRWQKDQGEYPPVAAAEDVENGGRGDEGGSAYGESEGSVDGKHSSEKPGLMLDPAAGLVLAADAAIEPRFIEFTKGYMADGKEFGLKLYGFYLEAGGALYQANKWPGTGAPLGWAEGKVEPFSEAFATSLGRARLGWEVSVSAAGCGDELLQASDRPTPDEQLTTFGRGNLIFDESARPLGFALEDYPNSVTGERFPWRGTDLAKAAVVKMADFDKAKPQRIERLGKYVYEVKIVYRQPEENEENLRFEGDDASSLTQFYYGYAVSPKQILVPVKMEKILIQRFKQITVQVGEREVKATFQGAFLDFGAFLIELADQATLPQALPLAGPALPEVNRAMLTYVAERKFGRRRDTVWYNRLTWYVKGYNDRLWPHPENALARGTLAMTFDEKPVGLCLTERQPEREKKEGEGRGGGSEMVRLYRLGELAEALKNPQAHFDPTLKPASEQEEKRTVWLGVEYQAMGPELAEMLDDLSGGGQAQKLSRNGEIGLRVTWVHKHSPAEKAGIAPGDVLLEIREEGKTEPIELRPRGEDGETFNPYAARRRSRGGFFQLSGSSRGGRAGYLTSLLTRLGAGTKIALVYLHGEEKVTQNFTLEWAPYDSASANKYKDEKTGVTVKDLTYDVRALLRLADDQPGVIVSKTEDGQKAAVADISPGVIITEINGKALRSVEDYEQAMTAIQKGKTGTAVLKLLWMGKNRMVKIEFP